MDRLFGTDGIRGRANRYPMIPETAAALGRAVAGILDPNSAAGVVIGTDTRRSADMLAAAAAAGVCSAGTDALVAGVIPTPAVARLVVDRQAAAGIVVSASHNPFADNGLKVFAAGGFKPDDAQERRIEDRIMAFFAGTWNTIDFGAGVGRIVSMADAEQRYLDFLMSHGVSLAGMKIAVDCANGAGYRIGPTLLADLGAEVTALGVSPDGENINDGCGSEHPGALIDAVRRTSADIGLALDGDGDRLVAVDDTGDVVTGDQIIAVCAAAMKKSGRLENNRVVTTVMSNLGLGKALKTLGIEHRITAVGDRQVLQEMRRSGAVLGGEDSGHLVFLDAHTTGDGLFAALRLLQVIEASKQPLSRLKTVMTVYPQVLINVAVGQKPDIEQVPAIADAVRRAREQLKDSGRVLVRYSGTQPMCRIMVEGPTAPETRAHCERIAAAVSGSIGNGR